MQSLPQRRNRIVISLTLAALITGVIAAVLWAILAAATTVSDSGSSRIDILHLLRMTSIQAGLTTLISLLVGTALAWALNRLRFPGRNMLIGIFSAAIVTPGMVVAFGMLSIWGRSGWINQASLAMFNVSIGNPAFGLSGILLAHVILDGAFAARILLARLDSIPQERLKTGQSLNLSPWTRFIILDWQAMRGTLPGLAAIIFLLAFTSFPIVLLLGGGPANQTLEVAIYAAVRQDFDLRGAVLLALTQIGVCSIIIFSAAALPAVPSSLGPSSTKSWRDRAWALGLAWIVLGLATLGFVLPLASVLVDGLAAGLINLLSTVSFWHASATSLIVGSISALLTLTFTLALSLGRSASASQQLRIVLGLPAYAYLAVPAVVLSLGGFLLVRSMGIAPGAAAPYVVVFANALLALPFAVATLGPPLDTIARSRGKLIRSLGLSSWQQFKLIEYPLLGRDVGVVLALSFCFSLGDLGVIALFGTQDFTTLPLLMFRALGAYRSDDAAAIAAILLIGTIAAFEALPRLFERLAHARR
ncbi:hypothetical protein PSQ19_09600 [Devosia algicola]|uniref:ABC transmembrane type-1 domain-containing protein n=1 Tax=Devosia algicola TaxID=3026418 RepID=A0ABY7YIR1_9HYPH|nr:hypothetical protein [Devosia algicola]WDR01147.1 hypothetical protein PSQ19_09600 [Devosia algicola]